MELLDALSASPAFFVCTVFVLGLLVGSFLNVVIYRVPVMLEREWRAQCAELAAQPAGGAADIATTAPGLSVPASAAPIAAPAPTSVPTPTPVPVPQTASRALPERFNLIVPRSACPACRAPIGALQNIPLLSYLLLRGRCGACGVRISARYPLVEALTAVLSALVAWKLGFGWPALAGLVLTWFFIALAFIDLDTQLLPDNMTLPLLWLGLAASLLLPAAGDAGFPASLRDSVAGAIAGYLSLWSIYHLFRLLTGKEGMGYGDFKLFAAVGAWLGLRMLLPTLLVAAAVGALIGIIGILMRGRGRGSPIAFGPFLAAAGWLMLLFGHELLAAYLGLFGLRS